jgi:SAM-dependent methyltransferase
MKVSVVVPAWNEWKNLCELLPVLLEDPAHGEVIVIDDASGDATDEDWSRFTAHPKLRRIRNSHRLGLACSVHQGIRAARGDFVLVRDSDHNHQLSAGPRLVALAAAGADLAVASRYRADTWRHFRRKNDLFSFLLNRALGFRDPRITEWTQGYFLLRKSLLEGLPCDWIFRGRGEYCVRLFLALLGRYPGLRVEETRMVVEARRHGRSTTRTFRHGLAYAALLLEPRPSDRPSAFVHGAGPRLSDSGHSWPGLRARTALVARESLAAPVLDLGCGNGAFTFSVFRSVPAPIDGVDRSEQALSFARARAYRRVARFDLGAPEPLGERYATLLLLETVQYLPLAALARLFRFAREHAAPGARLLCLAPHREGIWHRVRRRLGFGAEDYATHVDPALTVALAAEAGWRLAGLRGASCGSVRVRDEEPLGPSRGAAHLLFDFRLSD